MKASLLDGKSLGQDETRNIILNEINSIYGNPSNHLIMKVFLIKIHPIQNILYFSFHQCKFNELFEKNQLNILKLWISINLTLFNP